MKRQADILVIGGAGRLGRRAAAALEADGAHVTRLVRPGDPLAKEHDVVELDVSDSTAAAVYAARFPRVLFASGAALPLYSNTPGMLSRFDTLNHRAPAMIAAAVTEAGGRFVHMGSALAAHARPPLVDMPFCRSERLGDAALLRLRRRGRAVAIVRIPSVLDVEPAGMATLMAAVLGSGHHELIEAVATLRTPATTAADVVAACATLLNTADPMPRHAVEPRSTTVTFAELAQHHPAPPLNAEQSRFLQALVSSLARRTLLPKDRVPASLAV